MMAATALMDVLDFANTAELDRLDDKLYEVVDGERIQKPWDVVPDLAAEVISPSDFAEASLHKLLEYFQAGV